MSILPVLFAATYSMVANVNYDATHAADCKGDLYLPLHVKSTTPMVLVIHGGAWSSGARTDMNGVAELFVRDLGFAVFNIDYRLAGANSRWPACGDDCVTAANFVLSDEFKRQYGLAYDKLWIVGASAGGHLALWTHVNLPKDKVAGTMALSAIGDPAPDSAFAPSRYKTLFGTDAYDLDAMNPVKRISSGMAPVLMTHMTNDGVVPSASSKNFAAAYADAGNSVEYYEYERDEEPNEGGHCIWRKDSDPHKLIASIERRIAGFVKAAIPSGTEKVARDLRVVSVSRRSDGFADAVTLAFGPGNGLVHRLWMAYGETSGGERMPSWEHCDLVGDIADDATTYTVSSIPQANKVRFFLQVKFPGDAYAVPVEYIEGTGSQYIDTGVKVSGGDTLKCLFRCSESSYTGGIMGTREGENAKNVTAMQSNTILSLDYNSSEAGSYRAKTGNVYANVAPYEIILSAAARTVQQAENKVFTATNGTFCSDEFTSDCNVFVFKNSGSPATENCAKGKMEYYVHERNGECLASYVPYRVGSAANGVYGFLDRVSGEFKASVTGTGFLGGQEKDGPDMMTSSTETVQGYFLQTARAIVSVSRQGVAKLDVVFGPADGPNAVNKVYLAWDETDRGRNLSAWAHLNCVGVLAADANAMSISIPRRARSCRVVTTVPFDGEDFLEPLLFVKGSDSTGSAGYYDLGLKIKGGDEIFAQLSPLAGQATIFGSRLDTANDKNVVAALSNASNVYKFILDYNNSDYAKYRFTAETGISQGNWYELTLSPSIRHASAADGSSMGNPSTAVCPDVFDADQNCWLFYASGKPSVTDKFRGRISAFSIRRGNDYAVNLCPCKKGSVYGFYDRVGGKFIPPKTGTFTGEPTGGLSPLVSVSGGVTIPPSGLVLILK